jgi:hypothetical protein
MSNHREERRDSSLESTISNAPMPRASCEVTLYRLYDIGYEIDLARAADLLAANAPERPRPARGEAQAIQIPNPPLAVRLGTESFPLAGAPHEIEVSARLFDFGVVSLRARISADSTREWGEFAAWGNQLLADPDWAARFLAWRDRLVQSARPAIEKPAVSDVAEDYAVFRILQLIDAEGRPFPVEALREEQVAALLFGEQRPLSAGARRDLLSPRFSYYEDDLTVLAWNAALVVEPVAEDTDVEYVLEFANAQLLELRYYDTVLDQEVPRIYVEIAAARKGYHLLGRRYSRLLAALQSRVADATELVERVENSLKVTEDVYLARIYAAALEIFRGRTWRTGIDRKVAIVREAYTMLNAESAGRRAEALELTITALIAVEIVIALLRH